MRPSSSPSDLRTDGIVDDVAFVQAMLDVEAALARAAARVGLVPDADAEAIAAACRVEVFDVEALRRAAAEDGTPVPALVAALTDRVAGPAARSIHLGATSQDIVDTAVMLVARDAVAAIVADVDRAGDAAARLAAAHRGTLMVGRTLLQHAAPITFGVKAAGWLSGLDDAATLLDHVATTRLAVQLGGAAGTRSGLAPHAEAVTAALAEGLGLQAALPWHTNRSRIGELAGALGVTAAAAAKPARDVILLAQTEVAEVREGTAGRGRSSAMPHKRNPVAAIAVVAAATPAPGSVATLLAIAGDGEHERAAGAWQAEWPVLRRLLADVGSAAAWLADCLGHLEVDPARMRANLDLTGGAVASERLAAALTSRLGRADAHRAVARAAASPRPMAEALADDPELAGALDGIDLDALADTARDAEAGGEIVDAALRRHGARSTA